MNAFRWRHKGGDNEVFFVSLQVAGCDKPGVDKTCLTKILEQAGQFYDSIVVKAVRRVAGEDECDIGHIIRDQLRLCSSKFTQRSAKIHFDFEQSLCFDVNRIDEGFDATPINQRSL